MHTCPCCSNLMLRHARRHQMYWFCRSCWQEMPFTESSPNLNLLSVPLEEQFAAAALTRSLVTVANHSSNLNLLLPH
jgi:DNA-directed RNA polymerase subunit M/transcription elongation factor TFIIS